MDIRATRHVLVRLAIAAGILTTCMGSSGARAQSHSDGFEDGIGDYWQIDQHFGAVSVATSPTHSGGSALEFTSISGGQRRMTLTHRFEKATNGVVSVWFFDTAPGALTLYAHLNLYNFSVPQGQPGRQFYVGIDDYEGERYRAYGPDVNFDGPPRSRGWHHLRIRVGDVGGHLAIDGVIINEFQGEYAFEMIELSLSGPDWRPNATYFYDDFSFEAEGVGVAFVRGDCNDDGTVDLSDGVCTLNWLFLGTETPGCMATIDTDTNGVVELTDAVRVFNYLFLGGPPPVPPFPDCGPLPEDEALTCEELPSSCEAP